MLIALQFYASGVLLQVIGDTTGVNKSTVSLAVHKHAVADLGEVPGGPRPFPYFGQKRTND